MEYLPISKINTFIFCPRRYFIEHILQDFQANHHVIEGTMLHERSQRVGEDISVWSDELGIWGKIDQVKLEQGQPIITEIKKGAMQPYDNDRAQLCALAICYEEVHGLSLDYGYIYYERSRRRSQVFYDDSLRQLVSDSVQHMRQLEQQEHYPDVTENSRKCQGCSTKESCQPRLQRKRFATWQLVNEKTLAAIAPHYPESEL